MNPPARIAAVLVALGVVLCGCLPPAANAAGPREGGLSVSITLPVNGTPVKGDVEISGTASGPEGLDLSVQLSIDGGPWLPADGGGSWSWLWSTFAFEDGPHDLTARVSGGGEEAFAGATYFVQNTAPLLVLGYIHPRNETVLLHATDIAEFYVRVDTSYMGTVNLSWSVDGSPTSTGSANWYNFSAPAFGPGPHVLEFRASAPGLSDAVHRWNVTVRPPAFPPRIEGSGPADRELVAYLGEPVSFNVTATDPQNLGLTYRWTVDLSPAPGNVTAHNITLSFNSTGVHTVEVTVTNGETNTTVRWNVTVEEPPSIGPWDLAPCTLYIVIGLILGAWYGRRKEGQGARGKGQGD